MGESLELYFDESGKFTETDPLGPRDQTFPSQMAGIWAAAGRITIQQATAVMQEAHREAGLPYGAEFHAKELPRDDRYHRLLGSVLRQLHERGWRTIRLVNREGVHFGSRSTNYTHMAAEMMIRLLEARGREGVDQIFLNVFAAGVLLPEEGDRLLETREHEDRIQAHLAFLRIRRGRARTAWRVTVRQRSALREPPLQICDLLSHASKGNFANCGPEQRKAFEASLGELDMTLTIRAGLESVDSALETGATGLAIQLIAEEWLTAGRPDPALSDRLERALGELGRSGALARGLHLRMLADWLEVVVEGLREFQRGRELGRWLLERVEAPLRERLPDPERPSLDEFQYAVRRRILTACNHSGALLAAREAVVALEAMHPRLLGRWELVSELAEGLLAASVHRTDCLEHEAASRTCEKLAAYYEQLTGLFGEELGKPEQGKVRSMLLGKALGTWLQSEVVRSAGRKEILDATRTISDRALEEFSTRGDVARQEQYRCMLETSADQPEAARGWLARSLDLPPAEATHGGIAARLAALSGPAQGFGLLHWARIGAVVADGSAPERRAFHEALQRHRLLQSEWVTDPDATYPAHGARRYLAVALAGEGETKLALSMLGHLRALRALEQQGLVLAVLQLAGTIEVAGMLWKRDPGKARELLQDRDTGASQLAGALLRQLKGELGLTQRVEAWRGNIEQVLRGAASDPPALLRAIGREAWL